MDVKVYEPGEAEAQVAKLVKAGHPPDLAQIGSYADYATAGLLYPASDLLSIRTEADFLPNLTDAGTVDNAQYGLPFLASTRLLYCNKKLFKAAGLEPPTTWQELLDDAEALDERGVKYPYALPLGSEEAQAETMQWLLSGGGGYTDGYGVYGIDSPENVDTFTWLKDELVGKGLTGPVAPGELNRADAFAAFAKGDVGMLNGHPSLMKMAGKKGVDYGMVPMPGVDGESEATMGVADWMTAFKENGHAEEVGDFLDFVYAEKNVLDFSREYDLLPVTTAASATMSEAEQDADLKPFLDELPLSELYPVGKTSWAEVSAAVKKRIGQAVSSAGNPSAVLSQLQATAASAANAE
jgi:multiple sugar transport system substrate-binding protein